MRDKVYVYSKTSLLSIIKEMLLNFEVLELAIDVFNNKEFKNNNILMILSDDIASKINDNFFLNNNVVVFFSKNQNGFDKTHLQKTKFFYGPINVKKFCDEIKAHFISKTAVYKNTRIWGEKMTNLNSGMSALLTPLEKEILIAFFLKIQIKREYLLERVLKINKDIETKTIESHLTRIRKKLLRIKSKIQISSKDDIFYLDG